MSNESWGAPSPQGPDWYQASDGLWYPPAGQAAAAPAAPAAPAPAPAPAPAAAPAFAPVAPVATAPVATAAPGGWEPGMVHLAYDAPTEQVPKFKWLFAIFTCLGLVINVIIAGIIAAFSTYAAIFGTLLKQRVHPKSHANIVKSYRAQWRLATYLMQWRNDIPAMANDGEYDDNTDRAKLSIAYGGEGIMRFGFIIKPFLAFGQLIKLFIEMILAYIAMIIGIIGIVTKGQFPQAQADKITTTYRHSMEFTSYVLLSDRKPTF